MFRRGALLIGGVCLSVYFGARIVRLISQRQTSIDAIKSAARCAFAWPQPCRTGQVGPPPHVYEEKKTVVNDVAQMDLESKNRANDLNAKAANQELEYRPLLGKLQDFALPNEFANQLLALKQGALWQNKETVANTNLSSSEMQVWLQVFRAQVGETLTGLLGESGFNSYHAASGSWMDQLGWEAKAGKRQTQQSGIANSEQLKPGNRKPM